MNTGHNPMLPLSEFTVTFVDHKLKKIKMEWADWWPWAGYPDYDLIQGYKITMKHMKDPGDVEIILPDNNPPYEIVWAT